MKSGNCASCRATTMPCSGVMRLDIWASSLRMLADHPVFGVGPDQFLNQFQARHQVNTHPRSVVGMDRDSGDHRRPALRSLYGPAAAFRIAADLHNSGDAHLLGQPDGFLGLEARFRLCGIEVAVRIDHRHWQRIG